MMKRQSSPQAELRYLFKDTGAVFASVSMPWN